MKSSCLLALVCAAALLPFSSISVLATDDAAPVGDGRLLVLAQVTQKPRPSTKFQPGQPCGSVGQITCCKKNSKGEEVCGCLCGQKLKGKPQHLVP